MLDDDDQASVRVLLRRAMTNPASVARLGAAELDLTLRVARRARLLGRLGADLKAAGTFDRLPQVARDQLESATVMAQARERVAMWELDRTAWALRDEPDVPLVCLKGCAYVLIGTPNTRGRNFADVDLLVPEEHLERTEKILNSRGWPTKHLTPYDDNYYRRWTHELPPLVHVEREVEVDLHHNILPRTARYEPDSADIIARSVRLEGSRYFVPAPEDIVLHAMVHLMTDSDLADKLRDLVDVRDLLGYFAKSDAGFWQRLVARAPEHDLTRPAFYALRYAQMLLDVELPETALAAMPAWGPPAAILWLMDRLVPRALFPMHPDRRSRTTALCRLLLFVRSHWLRMPPWLLAYHLSYKFYVTRIRRIARETAPAA